MEILMETFVETFVETSGEISPGRTVRRPRVESLLAGAKKIACIVAGAGCGKTEAARSFIARQPLAIVRWLELAEEDNAPPYFWGRLLRGVARDNDELAGKLAALGFPDSLAAFKRFKGILAATEYRAERIYLVLDDFHQISDKSVLRFAERMAYVNLPDLRVFYLSRQEPKINLVPFFAKGRAAAVTEEELRFTEGELGEFLEAQGLACTEEELAGYHEATMGWPLGARFLSLALARAGGQQGRASQATKAMRDNVHRLFEAECFQGLPPDAQKKLVEMSLTPDAPPDGFDESMAGAPELSSFVLRDSLSGETRIHPLYHSFLRTKQGALADDQRRAAYARAARRCMESGRDMSAAMYFAEAGQYGEVLKMLSRGPHKMPGDACRFYLGVLGRLPDVPDEPSLAIIKAYFEPLLLLGDGRHEEARQLTLAELAKWERADPAKNPRLSHIVRYLAHSNLAYFDMYECTVTHRYEAPAHLRRAMEHRALADMPDENGGGPFHVPSVRSYACLVGEGAGLAEFDEFLRAARETASLLSGPGRGMFSGYDELVACELSYYKNELPEAMRHAHRAIRLAREKKQWSVDALTRKYLLRMAVHAGDPALARDAVSGLMEDENPSFWNRRLLCDLIMGSFYALAGAPQLSPPWLSMTGKEARREVRVPVAELAVALLNCIARNKHERALTILSNSHPRRPIDRFHFGELHFSLISAIARLGTGDEAGGMEDFRRAHQLSFDGAFEMFFVEMGRHAQPLVSAALRRGDTGISEKWLARVGRRAAIFAKKAANVCAALRRDAPEASPLSRRESEVLSDLYHGLTRDEIAENRFLSVNTVKKILQSVFIKLDASNSAQAIRAAAERGLL